MRLQETLEQLAAGRQTAMRRGPSPSALQSFPVEGPNPGALSARVHIPATLPADAPLVVVLHGCTQTAADYDMGTGWSRLADQTGFALLFPQQSAANNPNLCFNWFQPADIARRGGEAESIALMVGAMAARHSLDRQRVFVTGLSAGGAMTAVMLATYPELFAGGAIIGGLPYGSASGVGAALRQMAGGVGSVSAVEAVERASGFAPGRWPTVSLWHGSADHTVVVGNMDALAAQWRGVHGADPAAVEIGDDAWCERRTWRVGGRAVVETRRIPDMGHGVPIDPSAPGGLGQAGPYMLPVGIDSTAEIARAWGLLPQMERVASPVPAAAASARRAPVDPARPASGVQKVIEDALRSAGLMR